MFTLDMSFVSIKLSLELSFNKISSMAETVSVQVDVKSSNLSEVISAAVSRELNFSVKSLSIDSRTRFKFSFVDF